MLDVICSTHPIPIPETVIFTDPRQPLRCDGCQHDFATTGHNKRHPVGLVIDGEPATLCPVCACVIVLSPNYSVVLRVTETGGAR